MSAGRGATRYHQQDFTDVKAEFYHAGLIDEDVGRNEVHAIVDV
jgi:hypothetical protein